MVAYYNEIEPYAAQWLRNLIVAGHIAPGDVDERSILDVSADDLKRYTQCHFFAGIGGWSYAARLAGWPDDRPLWTGSCPCQPFSGTGKHGGEHDKRHLWPSFFRLIRSRRPDVVMGEQVAAAVGKNWLDGVHSDLEGIGYSCGAVVVPACAVDAPHRRDRLWFVADSEGVRREQERSDARGRVQGDRPEGVTSGRVSRDSHLPVGPTPGGHQSLGCGWDNEHSGETLRIFGTDRRYRRGKSGIPLLAHGVPARVGKLRAYGNAIVPQVAAEVIGAYMETF